MGIQRRTALKLIAASGVGALATSLFLKEAGKEENVRQSYQEEGFSDAERASIQQLAADIIPEDQDPGAGRPAIVNVICFALLGLSIGDLAVVRHGISRLNEFSQKSRSANFYELPKDAREDVIKAVSSAGDTIVFWAYVRSITAFIFYTDPLGYDPIGLPGPNVGTKRFESADREHPHGECPES